MKQIYSLLLLVLFSLLPMLFFSPTSVLAGDDRSWFRLEGEPTNQDGVTKAGVVYLSPPAGDRDTRIRVTLVGRDESRSTATFRLTHTGEGPDPISTFEREGDWEGRGTPKQFGAWADTIWLSNLRIGGMPPKIATSLQFGKGGDVLTYSGSDEPSTAGVTSAPRVYTFSSKTGPKGINEIRVAPAGEGTISVTVVQKVGRGRDIAAQIETTFEMVRDRMKRTQLTSVPGEPRGEPRGRSPYVPADEDGYVTFTAHAEKSDETQRVLANQFGMVILKLADYERFAGSATQPAKPGAPIASSVKWTPDSGEPVVWTGVAKRVPRGGDCGANVAATGGAS